MSIDSGLAKELDLTSDALTETAHLQKHFGRYDILFFTICTLVGIDTIGTVAASGAQAFTWLIIFAIVFFVPQALLFAELGTSFPQEGGSYLWARLAFGRLAAAINNVLYWVTNPVWLGGTLALVGATAYETFFLNGHPMSNIWWYIFTLAFIWIGVTSAILSFKVGKWIPTFGAFARFILLGFFSISVVIYGFKNGVHGVHVGDFGISFAGLVALAGVLLFNYVGFELPNSAGDEMKDPRRDIPYGLFRAAIAAVLLYGLPILGILVVLPTQDVSNLGGFLDAIKAVFTIYGGSTGADGVVLTGFGAFLGGIGGLLFIICVLSSGVTWIMGSDRSLAVSGYDGAAPRSLGVISAKYGTPVRVNILSGMLSTAVLVMARTISEGNAMKYFTAVLGIAVSTTLLSYLAIFPALWRLRVTHPDHPRPYRAPWAKFLSVWLTLIVAFASLQLVAPGLGVDWFGDDFRPDGWEQSERWKFLFTEAVPVLFFVLVGVVFWIAGGTTRKHAASARK